MTFHPAPESDSFLTNPVCLSLLCKRSASVSPSTVEDFLLHFNGVTTSSMPRSATETHARIQDKKPVPCDDKNLSAKARTESTSDPSLSDRTDLTPDSTLQEDDSDPLKTPHRPTSITQQDYKPGDIVKVKVDNLYQVGMVHS